MSFREKSAWVMAAVMVVTGAFYGIMMRTASQALGTTAPAAMAIGFVMLVVIGSIIVQVVLALSSPREASAPADERERLVTQRAGHWSGLVLATCTVTALGHFLLRGDGNMLFHLVMGSLIVSHIAEYAFQISLLRRSV
ncbi:MAG: hypothetical protein LH610_01275 [Sphingomonas bacterium]|nr:hypothetical protein [Sphingomonas bacterium]